jgi:hypothetical protein
MNTDTNTLFITAARKKYRFDSGRGLVTVEDLFDLALESLDKIAVGLDEAIQKAGKKSFIAKRTDSTTELDNKLEIVKFVITTKQEEAEARKARSEKVAKKAMLEELLNKKNLEKLQGMSAEEIQKQIDELS